jgi:hypothetical protein
MIEKHLPHPRVDDGTPDEINGQNVQIAFGLALPLNHPPHDHEAHQKAEPEEQSIPGGRRHRKISGETSRTMGCSIIMTSFHHSRDGR